MKKILIIFLAIVSYKLIKNIGCYFRILKLSRLHDDWLDGNDKSNITKHRQECISLFQNAGLKDSTMKMIEAPDDSLFVSIDTISLYDNFPTKDKRFTIYTKRLLEVAKSIYLQRIKQSICPLYWIELVIFAPKKILIEYLEFNENEKGIKLTSLILTFIWWIFGLLVVYFNQSIKEFIINFLKG